MNGSGLRSGTEFSRPSVAWLGAVLIPMAVVAGVAVLFGVSASGR